MIYKKSNFFCRLCFIIFFAIVLQFSIFGQAINSYWTLVFAGDNVTTPVFWNRNIYTAGKDRALNCISSDGKFVWRRNTEELPSKFLSVSNSGIVYLITKNGNLEVFSSQGMPAWKYKLNKKPLFPVFTARDGRAFVIQSDKIICFTPTGKLKWELSISSEPISPPAETGAREIILILKSGYFVRVSIFGSIVDQHQLKKTVTAIGEAPAGYILACADGSISYYKVSSSTKTQSNNGSTSVWQFSEKGLCKKIIYFRGKVLYLFKNGEVILKTIETNKEIWRIKTKANFDQNSYCRIAGNEFNIVATGYGTAITEAGKLKWERQIPEKDFLPIITENGLLVGITQEFLNAYRTEMKLTRRGKKYTKEPDFYSIINTNNQDPSKVDIPFFIEYATVSEFLKNIEQDIQMGKVGTKEPRYAFQLKTILQNKRKASYNAQNFSSQNRAKAAELLGRLGSYEYRNILIAQIKGDYDSTVAAGILRGLSHLAYDPDGKTIEAVKFLIQKAYYDDTETMKSGIDCLYSLVKYGDENTAKKAISLLFSIINGPYSSIIQNYARQKIKNIV